MIVNGCAWFHGDEVNDKWHNNMGHITEISYKEGVTVEWEDGTTTWFSEEVFNKCVTRVGRWWDL